MSDVPRIVRRVAFAGLPDLVRRVSFAGLMVLAIVAIGLTHPPTATAQQVCSFWSVLGMESLEIGGHLCANAGLYANEGVIGAARVRCGGQAESGYAIFPPALHTEPDSFPGSTYYFVTAGRTAGVASLALRDRDGIVLGTWLEGTSPHSDLAWKLTPENILEVECRSGWLFDHDTGIFPPAADDSAVVVNFGGVPSSVAMRTDLTIGAGGPPIRTTLINTRFVGNRPADRYNRNYWIGGATRIKGHVQMDPVAGLGLAVKALSSSGPVTIGSENFPMGIYTTGTLDFSSSNWTIVGSAIALGDIVFGGNGTITSLAHLGRRVPPFLKGWPNFCYPPVSTDPGSGAVGAEPMGAGTMAAGAAGPVVTGVVPTVVLTPGYPTRIVLWSTKAGVAGSHHIAESGGVNRVTVAIVDVTGRRVAEIIGRLVGDHGDDRVASIEFEWDGHMASGTRATPGLYFARSPGSPGMGSRRLLVVR